MVCKEEVLSWFKDLDSYKRIDMLYELLNMCLPFELRFLGSCVEEIGKHTYQELRGPAILANDYEKLSKDASLNEPLSDDQVRHRVLRYLSLLSSRNYIVANWLYKHHLRTEWTEEFLLKHNITSESVLSEYLLLYTMALHHPAFTFEQKLFFGNVLSRLAESKDSKNMYSPKPSIYGYPPGFGYPSPKFKQHMVNFTTVPGKTAVTMSYGDSNLHQSAHNLIHLSPQPQMDYSMPSIWSRPGFPCGAPEVPPFPPPPAISPLVSHGGTPTHSRSSSPLRTTANVRLLHPARPPPLLPIAQQPNLEILSPPHPQADLLSQSSLPMFGTELKLPDDELNALADSQPNLDNPWTSKTRGVISENLKQPNGLSSPSFKLPTPYVVEQMQALNLEGENSLHHSNSSSSSSLNQSPPDTPTTVAPHGPGRGEKPSLNGIPQQPPVFVNSLPPLCDTTSPPPAFNNCTVPSYASFPATFNQMPNRSLFQYSQPYGRPPPYNTFAQSYHSPENSIPQYTVPYVSIMYSSPPFPPRHQPIGCYNCGAAAHTGEDCKAQNIEEITQKKSYSLDFNSATNDTEK